MQSGDTPMVIAIVDGVVHVGGEIDLATAPRLDACLDAATGGLRIDLSEVTFVDSIGLRVLLDHHRVQRRRGEVFRIVAMSQPVRRLLQLTGLLAIFTEGSAQPA